MKNFIPPGRDNLHDKEKRLAKNLVRLHGAVGVS